MAERLATQKYAMSVSEQDNPTAWDKQLCTVKKAVSLGCGVIGEKLIENRIVPESALYKKDNRGDTKYDGNVNFGYSVSNKSYTPGIVLCKTNTFSATNCYGKAIGGYNISTGTTYVSCQIGANMGMVVYIFVSPNTNDYTAANFSLAEAYTVTKLNISHAVSLGGVKVKNIHLHCNILCILCLESCIQRLECRIRCFYKYLKSKPNRYVNTY